MLAYWIMGVKSKIKNMVSVIIPCHNAAIFLCETLDSVFCQEYKNLEVILVDDGSTDDTRKIVDEYGHNIRLEVMAHSGASLARNRGTLMAEGEFIQYLDADDLLCPNAIEKRIQFLTETGADVAYSDWQYFRQGPDGHYHPGDIVTRLIEDIHHDPQIALFAGFWAPPASLLYRRGIVDKIGGWSPSLPIIQDARFLLDAALHGAYFIHVPEIGAYYRVQKGSSLSTRDFAAFNKDIYLNARQIEEWWFKNGGLTEERRLALVGAYACAASGLLEWNQTVFKEAFKDVRRLDRNYLPKGPYYVRILSWLLGYESAEHMALFMRKFKLLVKSIFFRPRSKCQIL